jgi:hypothetical protein
MQIRILTAAALAAATLVTTTPARADDWMGTALGAVVGGVVGNQFGSGSGNVAATALGAAIGSRVGTDLYRSTPSYGSGYNHGYRDYGYRDNVRYAPIDYRPPPAWGQRRYYEDRVVYPAPVVVAPVIADACGAEQYYEGRYDPEMARAYCRGRQEYLRNQRDRELAEARSRGLSGQ